MLVCSNVNLHHRIAKLTYSGPQVQYSSDMHIYCSAELFFSSLLNTFLFRWVLLGSEENPREWKCTAKKKQYSEENENARQRRNTTQKRRKCTTEKKKHSEEKENARQRRKIQAESENYSEENENARQKRKPLWKEGKCTAESENAR